MAMAKGLVSFFLARLLHDNRFSIGRYCVPTLPVSRCPNDVNSSIAECLV